MLSCPLSSKSPCWLWWKQPVKHSYHLDMKPGLLMPLVLSTYKITGFWGDGRRKLQWKICPTFKTTLQVSEYNCKDSLWCIPLSQPEARDRQFCPYLSDEINVALSFLHRWRARWGDAVSFVTSALLCCVWNSRQETDFNKIDLLDHAGNIKALGQNTEQNHYSADIYIWDL